MTSADRPDAELIAPFVAWMATQELGETVRREYREDVEDFLTWCRADDGPRNGRRGRYERGLDEHSPHRTDGARAALDRYVAYRELVARTLPTDS